MPKLIVLLIIAVLLGGCVSTSYPAGATAFERWQIDRYEEQQLIQMLNTFQPQQQKKYCNFGAAGVYCW